MLVDDSQMNNTACVYLSQSIYQSLCYLAFQAANSSYQLNQTNAANLSFTIFEFWQVWELAYYSTNVLAFLQNGDLQPLDSFWFDCAYSGYQASGFGNSSLTGLVLFNCSVETGNNGTIMVFQNSWNVTLMSKQ